MDIENKDGKHLTERERIAFQFNQQFLGDLLKLNTQVMLMTVTINGALLVAIGSMKDALEIKLGLFFLGILINVFIVFMLKTIERHMIITLDKILEFSPDHLPRFDNQGWFQNTSTVSFFSVILAIVSIGHAIGLLATIRILMC